MKRWAVSLVVLAIGVGHADPIDDYLRTEMKARRLPGVSLAVVKNGKLVKAAGYGLASLELQVPATEHTVYEIGSISKQFAADAVLLMRDDRKLALDDPLSKYLPRTPDAWTPVTIRHVLTHTGGFADFDTGNIGFSYRREYTAGEFIDLLAAQPLQFTPGTKWNYTNAFPLAGIVVEKAAGMPYDAFLRERIFKPLKLDSARLKHAEEVVPHRAQGYLPAGEGYKLGEPFRPRIIAANGGVMINAVDFAKWDIAMTTGKLLTQTSLDEMTQPVRLENGRTVSHGLGWFMDTFNGHRFGAHWGSTVAGYSAVIRRYDEGVTIILLANLDDGAAGVDAISKHLAGLYLPGASLESMPPRPEPAAGDGNELAKILASIAAGQDHPRAPGLATQLPPAARQRIAAVATPQTPLEYLGDERLTDRHFNLDPNVHTVRRYRSRTNGGFRYLTIRLSDDGTIRGVTVE